MGIEVADMSVRIVNRDAKSFYVGTCGFCGKEVEADNDWDIIGGDDNKMFVECPGKKCKNEIGMKNLVEVSRLQNWIVTVMEEGKA